MLAFLKINPFWKPMESVTAENFIKNFGGNEGWKTLWEPLLYGKFGSFASQICASWFWARIHKRTTNLGYFRGGFQTLIDHLEKAVKSHGGEIRHGLRLLIR